MTLHPIPSPHAQRAIGCALLALLCACSPAAPEEAGPVCQPFVVAPADAYSDAASPYLGCVNRANLAHEIVRPSDLAAGRTLGPADGAHATLGVDAYQQGKIKSFDSGSGSGGGGGATIVMPGASSGGE